MPGRTTPPSWANNGTSTPSWARDVLDSVNHPQPQHHGGGGFLGGLKEAAHFVADKTERAAHDVKSIPGGLYDMVNTEQHLLRKTIAHPLANPNDPRYGVNKGKWGKHAQELVHGMEQNVVESVKHPLRDPFQTLMTVAPVYGAVGKAVDVGTLGRLTESPRTLRMGDSEVPLKSSRNSSTRIAQGLHDKAVQHALDNSPESLLGRYGARRVGGSINETANVEARMRAVPAQLLQHAAKRLRSPLHRADRVAQAALELTSVNTAPEDAVRFHLEQVAKGVNVAQNEAVAKLYQAVADRGLLTRNEHGDVVVNEAEHPKLAVADAHLAEVQGRGDEILRRYGVRSADALEQRVNAPGRIRAGGSYEKPTPSKNGVPSTALLRQRAQVDRLQSLHDRAMAKFKDEGIGKLNESGIPQKGSARVERLGAALSVAKDKLASMEAAAERRIQPTGIVGGNGARPGRGFVSYATSEPAHSQGAVAGSPGKVIGEAKTPITSQEFTGKGIEHGLVPEDVTGQAARHFQQIVRFVNTSEIRNAIAKTGTAVRRTRDDVLIRVPGEGKVDIPREVEDLLGRKKITVDDAEAINAALQAFKEELLPGLRDNFAKDRRTGIGTPAPEGYRWVNKRVVGDLAKGPRGPRGNIARGLDSINSMVTAATVYFKFGHIFTRAFTNASTNLIQGSVDPFELGKTYKLWKALPETDRRRALAAAGQHGYEAMPHEGTSKAAIVAGHGANWYARHFDAPFRFNSIAYEARRERFDTPEKFRQLLHGLEHPGEGDTAFRAKVENVAKSANRENIAYDRMTEAQRRFIARGIWFFPWVKGTIDFAANTAMEHPYKTGVLGAAGGEGRDKQFADLGELPTYEGGLVKLGGGAANPLVTDFSTFSPFATPADVAEAVAKPKKFSDMLNPSYAALAHLIFGLDQFGNPTNQPYSAALGTLLSPTPEAQIAQAFQKPKHPGMFRHTPLDALLRMVGGPATPRRLDVAAAHKAAGREKSGR